MGRAVPLNVEAVNVIVFHSVPDLTMILPGTTSFDTAAYWTGIVCTAIQEIRVDLQ